MQFVGVRENNGEGGRRKMIEIIDVRCVNKVGATVT